MFPKGPVVSSQKANLVIFIWFSSQVTISNHKFTVNNYYSVLYYMRLLSINIWTNNKEHSNHKKKKDVKNMISHNSCSPTHQHTVSRFIGKDTWSDWSFIIVTRYQKKNARSSLERYTMAIVIINIGMPYSLTID